MKDIVSLLLYSQTWEMRREREAEEMFGLRGMTYEKYHTRSFFHAKVAPEDAKQTLAESCHSGAQESGSARSEGCSTQAALLHLG